jgi:hypothetical protein
MLKKLFPYFLVVALLGASWITAPLMAQQVARFVTLTTTAGTVIGSAATSYLTVRLTDGTNFLSAATDSTHDSAASSTGPQQMIKATTDLDALTAVSDGDATRSVGDTLGRQFMTLGCGKDNRIKGYLANTDGASTALTGMGAQGSGVIIEVWSLVISNSSATDVTVDLRDGTAGSVLATFIAPATTDTGGGAVVNLNVPIQFTANTAVAIDGSAAATTLYVTALGCTIK